MNGAVDEWILMICFWLAAMWNCDYFCIQGTRTPTHPHTHIHTNIISNNHCFSVIIISESSEFCKHYSDLAPPKEKNKTTTTKKANYNTLSLCIWCHFRLEQSRSTGGATFKATVCWFLLCGNIPLLETWPFGYSLWDSTHQNYSKYHLKYNKGNGTNIHKVIVHRRDRWEIAGLKDWNRCMHWKDALLSHLSLWSILPSCPYP